MELHVQPQYSVVEDVLPDGALGRAGAFPHQVDFGPVGGEGVLPPIHAGFAAPLIISACGMTVDWDRTGQRTTPP